MSTQNTDERLPLSLLEPRVTIVATDFATADALVGAVPIHARIELWLLGTDDAGDALSLPVDLVRPVPGVPADSSGEIAGRALKAHLPATGPILLGSSQLARDLAGWLTVNLDAPLVWAIDGLALTTSAVEAERVVLGGSHRLVHRLDLDGPSIVLAKPTIPASAQNRPVKQPVVDQLDVTAETDRVSVLSSSGGDGNGIPLAGARLVVSVGRGIGSPENIPVFQDLAASLGAALGASRVVVDSGWLPFSHQVGQTGTAVSPDVYLAFGISGAIQHLAGMRTSRTVVAVNTDPDAPLCRQADLVVKEDAVAVAQRLLSRLSSEGER